MLSIYYCFLLIYSFINAGWNLPTGTFCVVTTLLIKIPREPFFIRNVRLYVLKYAHILPIQFDTCTPFIETFNAS